MPLIASPGASGTKHVAETLGLESPGQHLMLPPAVSVVVKTSGRFEKGILYHTVLATGTPGADAGI